MLGLVADDELVEVGATERVGTQAVGRRRSGLQHVGLGEMVGDGRSNSPMRSAGHVQVMCKPYGVMR